MSQKSIKNIFLAPSCILFLITKYISPQILNAVTYVYVFYSILFYF